MSFLSEAQLVNDTEEPSPCVPVSGRTHEPSPRLTAKTQSLNWDCVKLQNWSGRRDSNPRSSAWEANALPLSHARIYLVNNIISQMLAYFKTPPLGKNDRMARKKQVNRLALQEFLKWCQGTELNRRHGDFQSPALPTELPWHGACDK